MVKYRLFFVSFLALNLCWSIGIYPNEIDQSERWKLKNMHSYYYEIPAQELQNRYNDYLALYWDDIEIKLYYSNLLEVYGKYQESRELLRSMEEEYTAKSNTHELTYQIILGYQLYFARKLNDQYEFDRINKKIIRINKIPDGFLKKKYLWVRIDERLKIGSCPTNEEFLSLELNRRNNKENFHSINYETVFARLHFDMTYDVDCHDQAKSIYEYFYHKYLENQTKPFFTLLFKLLQSDLLLHTNQANMTANLENIYSQLEAQVKNDMYAPWILDEINYRRQRLNLISK